MSEKSFSPEIKKEVKFVEDENWIPDNTDYHHEPRLAEESHELVNQAIEVYQDDCEALDSKTPRRFLKSYGIGPCILLCISNSEGKQLGVIHFDANSNISLLADKLYKKLGIDSLNGFKTELIGGIEGMPGSEDLKNDLVEFFDKNKMHIDIDNSMKLSVSDYENLYTEDSVPMLFYQSVIIDKETGKILSFNPHSDRIKK